MSTTEAASTPAAAAYVPAPASDAGSKRSSNFVDLFSDVDTSETEGEPTVITPELLAALVRQVEFYLSDANLPTDKKLLKLVRKDSHGYVPVKLFVNFRKIRSLTKDPDVVAMALRDSKELALSADEKTVRRVVPVPEYDIAGIQKRTIIVENLPPALTIEDVTHMFEPFGSIKVVRICAKDGKSKLPGWLTQSIRHQPSLPHAYIEYDEEDAALRADAMGNNEQHDLRVTRLTSLLQHLHGMRDDSSNLSSAGMSRRGSSKGSSLRSSRDVSPSSSNRCARGFGAGSTGGRSASGLPRPGAYISRTASIGSSAFSDRHGYDPSGRRYSNSSAASGGSSMGGASSRSATGSAGGSDGTSWMHMGTPPAAPSVLRRSDSDHCQEGPWASVCPAAPEPGAVAAGADIQPMPTLADGIISSQLEGCSAGRTSNDGSGGSGGAKAVYVPPGRRSVDGNRSAGGYPSTGSPVSAKSGGSAGAGPDLAAAAARNHAPSAVDSPVLAPSSPLRRAGAAGGQPVAAVAPARLQIPTAQEPSGVQGPESPVPNSVTPTKRASPAMATSPVAAGSPTGSSALRCNAPPYVPGAKPPLASPPTKRAPTMAHANPLFVPPVAPQPAMYPAGTVVMVPMVVPADMGAGSAQLLNNALNAMLADVLATKHFEGNAAAFAAAAAASALGVRPAAYAQPPPPPPRNAAGPNGGGLSPASPTEAPTTAGPPPPPPRATSSAPKFCIPGSQQGAGRGAAGGHTWQQEQLAPFHPPAISCTAPVHAAAAPALSPRDRPAPQAGGGQPRVDANDAKRHVSHLLAGLGAPGTMTAPAAPRVAAAPKAGAQAPKSLAVRPRSEAVQAQAVAQPKQFAPSGHGQLDQLMWSLERDAEAHRAQGAADKSRMGRVNSAGQGAGNGGAAAPLMAGVATAAVVVAVRPGAGQAGGKVQDVKGSGAMDDACKVAHGVAQLDVVRAGADAPRAAMLSEGGMSGSVYSAMSGTCTEEEDDDDGEEGEGRAVEEGEDAPRRRRKRGTRTRGRGGKPRRTTGSEAGGARSSAGGCGAGGLGPRGYGSIPMPPRQMQRSGPGDEGWAARDGVEREPAVHVVAAGDDEAVRRTAKRDYAAWAAATPEYRAEASALAAAAGSGHSPVQSPPRPVRAPSPADDDWRAGRERSPGAPAQQLPPMPSSLANGKPKSGSVSHLEMHMHSMLSSRGPDGSRGFGMGRGRALKPPMVV